MPAGNLFYAFLPLIFILYIKTELILLPFNVLHCNAKHIRIINLHLPKVRNWSLPSLSKHKFRTFHVWLNDNYSICIYNRCKEKKQTIKKNK